ncbi:STAS domain-containing protein [methane-oxidizing endosymbiont of Gigantopelta aegis]|uniref:STAS domain-containing protein n=1 Tax=methane-oxidizing endosymbiont of Gigantopelta aegis TaxID=2794938 RepID=UPI0018DDBE0F|nr:STAS domain-containing protein [methane-oxidizing endosymbiont of Gigantopelta aegis]
MDNIKLLKQDSGEYKLHGELTFNRIDKNTARLLQNLTQTKHLVIDLSPVKRADSAGLALLIEWIKQSVRHQQKICFKNIPEQLTALAALSGFDNSDYFIQNCTTKAKLDG